MRGPRGPRVYPLRFKGSRPMPDKLNFSLRGIIVASALQLVLALPLGAQQENEHHMHDGVTPMTMAPEAMAVPSTSVSASPVMDHSHMGHDPQPRAQSVLQTPPLSSVSVTRLPSSTGVVAVSEIGPENGTEIETVSETATQNPARKVLLYLEQGGPAIWAITTLSVLALAVILWKLWRFLLIGAWARGRARGAVELWVRGEHDSARARVARSRTLRSRVLRAAFAARTDLTEERAREETARVARNALGDATGGLRALELIATIAPLLGLLGTVLGMIAAFQTLQQSGNRADPAMLAGGIWEALLTTAAGMAVAIPASAALTWFEAVIERMRRDVEDAATRIFIAPAPIQIQARPR